MNSYSKKTTYKSTPRTLLAIAISAILTSACGGGGGTDDYTPPSQEQSATTLSLNGGGFKGPMINSVVTVYAFDINAEGFRGKKITTGTTDESAKINGITLPGYTPNARTNEEFFASNFIVDISDGTVITSGSAPSIQTLTTFVTGKEYVQGVAKYATPYSTLALKLTEALLKADQTTTFDAALNKANTTIKKTLGFGLFQGIDPFKTIPALTEAPNHQLAINYRTAIESLGALLVLAKEASGRSTDELLNALAQDLTDKNIDGTVNNEVIPALSDIPNLYALISTPPETLLIPNTSYKISDILDIMQEEAKSIAPGVAIDADAVASQPKPATAGAVDSDKDGVPDSIDNFPLNAKESLDSDGDCGLSDDTLQSLTTGDGCGDNSDWASEDASVLVKCDIGAKTEGNDGDIFNAIQRGENHCADPDNDGFEEDDLFPFNDREHADKDVDCGFDYDYNQLISGDGCGDNSDPTDDRGAVTPETDSDGDGVVDIDDIAPYNPNEQLDSDGDCGIDDNTLQSIQTANGCGDASDWAPNDPAVQNQCDLGAKTNGDSGDILNAIQRGQHGCSDPDHDGFVDDNELFPFNGNENADTDSDCGAGYDYNQLNSGDDCGDNNDVNYCYAVRATGDIPSESGVGYGTAHGFGYASIDSYTGIATFEMLQRASVRRQKLDPLTNAADATLVNNMYMNLKDTRYIASIPLLDVSLPQILSEQVQKEVEQGNTIKLSNCRRNDDVAGNFANVPVCPGDNPKFSALGNSTVYLKWGNLPCRPVGGVTPEPGTCDAIIGAEPSAIGDDIIYLGTTMDIAFNTVIAEYKMELMNTAPSAASCNPLIDDGSGTLVPIDFESPLDVPINSIEDPGLKALVNKVHTINHISFGLETD